MCQKETGLMLGAFLATTLVGFNSYPGFTDPNSRIEAVIDKGLIFELIVRCERGTGIIAASPIEQTFCTPKFVCYASLSKAVDETCR
jgi:hypothetical protein